MVDLSRLVMAIWSLSAIWDITGKLPTEHQAEQETQDHNTGPGGEAIHVRTHTRG